MCACAHGRRLPSVADCQEAAAATGLDGDVALLPDGYQTLVRCGGVVDGAARCVLWCCVNEDVRWVTGQA